MIANRQILITLALILISGFYSLAQEHNFSDDYYEFGWNEYEEFYVDSISGNRFVVLDIDYGVIDTAYAVAHEWNAMWLKMDSVELSDNYCEYYQYKGKWKYLGTSGHPMNGKIYGHPMSFEESDFQILDSDNYKILNEQGDTLLETNEYLYEISTGLFASNVSFGYYDPYKLIPEAQCDFIFDAQQRQSIKIAHPFHIGYNGNILIAREIENEVLYRILDAEESYTDVGPEASIIDWMTNYNIMSLMGWENMEFPYEIEISHELKTLVMLQMELGSEDDDWMEPYGSLAFVPDYYNVENMNYRCYSLPGQIVESQVNLQSPALNSISVYRETYEITGGPISTIFESYYMNFIFNEDEIQFLQAEDVFKDPEELYKWLNPKWMAFLDSEELDLDEDVLEEYKQSFINEEGIECDFIILEEGIQFQERIDTYEVMYYGYDYDMEFIMTYEELKSWIKKDFWKEYIDRKTKLVRLKD